MKVALLGLGKMGTALAERILKANFDLTIYNRTTTKIQSLVAAGANSAKAAVTDADVIITCLLNDDAVMQTVNGKDGFLSAVKPGTIHIGTSTILPTTSNTLTKLHNESSKK